MAIALSDYFKANCLEQLFSGQTNWTTVLSANVAVLNYLLPFVKAVVESIVLKEPSAFNPMSSPLYFIPENPTGAFTGHAREFALYDPGIENWKFFTPYEGYTFFCKEDKKEYIIIDVNGVFTPTER